ncbi:MAG: hypothetical protein JSW03_00515 [Candidatus Eiseniibacteriota bacterium]|nr:MAG: hypothetical protein JSW03_00515 [Candidatus Eisenbacteria bacterium]
MVRWPHRFHSASILSAVVLFLAVASLLVSSCGERERANPLDPLNPETGGSPPGFQTLALDGRVELRWSPLQLQGLTGYNAYRRERTERTGGLFQLLEGSPFSSGLGRTTDSSVTNGTTYEYKLVPLIQEHGEGTSSPVLAATPGPHFAVASDGWSGLVRKFSADMRASLWSVGGLYYPFSVASNGADVWVTDLYAGLFRLTGEGALLWGRVGFLLPVWVSVTAGGRSAVVDQVSAAVTVFSPDGATEATITEGLEGPTCASFGPQGELWVADPVAGSVRKYSSSGSLVGSFTSCLQPRFLDVEMGTGVCWVGDVETSELIRLSPEANELARVSSFSSVTALEVDEYSGGCWLGDGDREEIVHVSGEGEILFRAGRVGRIVHIYVAADDGSVWLADRKGRLLALTKGGKIISSTTISGSPTSVTVLRESRQALSQ